MDLIELRVPSDTVVVAEAGDLDERARLAFGAGQCHGLAVALKQRTGWPLVAVDDVKGKRIHVCVRAPDGALIDVNGAHNRADFEAVKPGCSLHDIDDEDIANLVQREGWAEPEVGKAAAWVDAVLRQAAKPAALSTPLQTPTLSVTYDHEPDLQIRFVWNGDPGFEISVRLAAPPDAPWVRYSYLQFPRDRSRGCYVIDFRPEVFAGLTEAFLRHQFNPAKAEAKLANA